MKTYAHLRKYGRSLSGLLEIYSILVDNLKKSGHFQDFAVYNVRVFQHMLCRGCAVDT